MVMNINFPDSLPPWIPLGFSLFVSCGMLALLIGSCRWAAGDATARGKSGCLVGLLVFFTWPLGLLLWLIARPDTKARSELREPPVRCVQPGCDAEVHQTGVILGTVSYVCDAGHEFIEPRAS